MRNVLTKDHLVQRVQQQFHQIIENGYDVTLTWLPSHVGILGNESVNLEAKKAAHKSPEFILIPFRNWFPEIRKRTNEIRNQKWREERRDFYELKPMVKKWFKIYKLSRREEVINRLRSGHTRVIHRYIFDYASGFERQLMCLGVRWSNLALDIFLCTVKPYKM